jgi:hypothetical protein
MRMKSPDKALKTIKIHKGLKGLNVWKIPVSILSYSLFLTLCVVSCLSNCSVINVVSWIKCLKMTWKGQRVFILMFEILKKNFQCLQFVSF